MPALGTVWWAPPFSPGATIRDVGTYCGIPCTWCGLHDSEIKKKIWKPPVPGNFMFSPGRSDSSLIEGNLLGSCLRGHTLTLAPQNFTTCNWWFLLLKLVLRVGTHTLQQHHHPSAFSDRLWRPRWQKLSPIPTPGTSWSPEVALTELWSVFGKPQLFLLVCERIETYQAEKINFI